MQEDSDTKFDTKFFWRAFIGSGLGCSLLISFMLWGCPHYEIYSKEMSGKAELAQAESNRRIKVLEALALKDSAELLGTAEVLRAKGVAESNKIIGDSLKSNEAYLRYLWITHLGVGPNKEVIYVPTEAGLPILEAGKR